MKLINLIKSSYERSLKNYLSYRFNFYGEIIFSFISIGFIYFLSRVFNETESMFLEKYNNNYFEFLFTGLIVLLFITRAFSGMTSFISDAQNLGYFESLLNTKTKLSIILLCSLAFPVTQAIFRFLLLYIFSFFISSNQISFLEFFEIILLLILTTLPFIGIGFLIISLLILFKKASIANGLFFLGCGLFSGIFYPLEVMPIALQKIALLFPSTFSVNMIRERVISETDYSSLLDELSFILILAAIYLFVGLKSLNYSLKRAKLKGVISHY